MEKMRHVSSVSPSRGSSLEGASDSPLELAWDELGPGNIGGRTMALAIDPRDGDVLYAGTAGGGIWKTTNGGADWRPLQADLANFRIAALAIDPLSPDTIYAGTGAGNFPGAGIYKSTDAGRTWRRLESTRGEDFQTVSGIAPSGDEEERLVVAGRGGLFVSIDGGESFKAAEGRASNCAAVAASTSSNGTIWLAYCRWILDDLGRFKPYDAVYRSVDGLVWTEVLAEEGMGTTKLAIRGSRAYAISASDVPGFDRNGDGYGDYQHSLHAFFRSDDGGLTWRATVRNDDAHVGNTVLLSYFSCDDMGPRGGQGFLHIFVAIDPLDPDIVWAGGISPFRSDDGGDSWGLSGYLHVDQLAMVFHPEFDGVENAIAYIANDGGVYKNVDSRRPVSLVPGSAADSPNCAWMDRTMSHWRHLKNGFAATQFYHGVAYPNGVAYLGGSQDNYTVKGNDGDGPNAWKYLACGDGGYSALNPLDTEVIYAACQQIQINKSTNGGASFIGGMTNGIDMSEGSIFIPPLIMDPKDPETLWFGGKRAWRTQNGANSWQPASLPFDGGYVTAIAVAPDDSNYVLAATDRAHVYRTANALESDGDTAWEPSEPSFSHFNQYGWVSSLAFDPFDTDTVFATVSSYYLPKIWRSHDRGETWEPAQGSGIHGIPEIPVLSIAFDPYVEGRVFAGSDTGIFVSSDHGDTWAVEDSGFPNVQTEWLTVITVAEEAWLFAFTHGRGAFRSVLSSAPSKPVVTNTVGLNGLFYDPETSGQGFDVNVHEQGMTVYFYGHTANGERLWLISELHTGGVEYGSGISLPLYEVPDGEFGTPRLPVSIWGSLSLRFDTCDRGVGRLEGHDGTIEIEFIRLAVLAGEPCEPAERKQADVSRILAERNQDPALNGLFYDPENPGHGFDFNVHAIGTTIYYYGHTADGERLWLISGLLESEFRSGSPVSMDLYEVIEGNFGVPSGIATLWGTLELDMSSCHRGSAALTSTDGRFTMELARLVGLAGYECSPLD
jgi:hypothetical protein